ncbi:MAG: metal-dependent hydrolase [Myxococcales bacterium]|nr:metal-dependent hydrolase [Myxococcales bacterium]
MDGITQALLGATVGQASVGTRLGRRAAWWGALGGLLPDADIFVSAALGGEFTSMWVHRGTSHSLWFGPALGPLLGIAVWRLERWRARKREPDVDLEAQVPGQPEGVNWTGAGAKRAWIWLFVLSIVTHPMLDVFTSYGTQLFAPFWRERFAFDGVGIVDPAYSVPLIIALAICSAKKSRPRAATRVARWTLALTSAYLVWGLGMTRRVEAQARAELTSAGFQVDSVSGYTFVMQNGLKRVVARSGPRVFVGYASGWVERPIAWQSFELEPSADVERVLATPEGRLFRWFSKGQLAWQVHRLENGGKRVELDDLRYGMPAAPRRGFWGVDAELSPGGDVLGVHRARRSRGGSRARHIGDIFRAAFGYDPRTYHVGVGGGVRETTTATPSPQ